MASPSLKTHQTNTKKSNKHQKVKQMPKSQTRTLSAIRTCKCHRYPSNTLNTRCEPLTSFSFRKGKWEISFKPYPLEIWWKRTCRQEGCLWGLDKLLPGNASRACILHRHLNMRDITSGKVPLYIERQSISKGNTLTTIIYIS